MANEPQVADLLNIGNRETNLLEQYLLKQYQRSAFYNLVDGLPLSIEIIPQICNEIKNRLPAEQRKLRKNLVHFCKARGQCGTERD